MYIYKSLKLAILALFIITLVIFSGCTPPNHTPIIISLTANPQSPIEVNQSTVITCLATDQDGDTLTYAWTKTGGTITGSGSTITWTAPAIVGTYTITCTVSDGELSTTQTLVITLSEDIVYRALCIGVGDYIYGDDDDDLPAPPYDVDRMIKIFNQCRFGPLNTEFSTLNYLKDWQATKSNILQGIASTFSAADNNDISYFCYGGHGKRHGNTYYLCPADVNSSLDLYISVDELENALSAIPGTKVVFLDTCYSGGFIGKGKGEITISKEELESFNDEIINVFSQTQSKGLLTTNQYKVLTACHYYQESTELGPIVPGAFDPYGVFTMALYTGCWYDGSYPADTNLDTKVSLQEAYLYVKSYVAELDAQTYFSIGQDVQVYPYNSTFTIVEY
jgi:hypothetical protein